MESRGEKAYEKHAWILFLIAGLFFLIFGAVIPGLVGNPGQEDVEALTGMTWDEIVAASPDFARLVTFEVQGAALYRGAWAFSIIAIASYAYRRGEKWSWYYLWSLPIVFAVAGIFFFARLGHAETLGFYGAWIVISLLGLSLPYRKFFPSKTA